jgi:hypothetical protein
MIEHYFVYHVGEMIKQAQTAEHKPWYGSTGNVVRVVGSDVGGALASMKAMDLVPKKYKLPVGLAASLTGTAAGLEAGEYAGNKIDELLAKRKKAEAKEPSIPRVVAEGLLGLGLGTAAGYGAGRGFKYLAGKAGVPYVTPLLPKIMGATGAVAGVSYPLWRAYEKEALRRAMIRRYERKAAQNKQ